MTAGRDTIDPTQPFALPPSLGADIIRLRSQVLQIDDDVLTTFVSDDLGWGVAIPYPWIMLGGSIPVAWWLVVHRDRRERQHRVARNQCRHCGYDLRMSTDHCPECGRYVGRLKYVDPV